MTTPGPSTPATRTRRTDSRYPQPINATDLPTPQQPLTREDSMTTNTQNWRRLANTRQWIIDNLSRKVQRLQEENEQLRTQLEHQASTQPHPSATPTEGATP